MSLSLRRTLLNATILRFVLGLVVVGTLVSAAYGVTIATVPVGYSGNAPDTTVMSDATTGYGAVAYSYAIGKYDVTNAQYAELLNSKASTADPYGLWSTYMGSLSQNGGDGAISRSAAAPYAYTVRPGYANKPVVLVTWYGAIRFVNWLTNGQGNGDTENGTYLISGGGPNSGTAIVPDAAQRAAWAATNSFHYLLPSEDEWYKAAYYNGPSATYYAYPFRSNSQPQAGWPPGGDNSGDFNSSVFNYDGNLTSLTDVGAYQNSLGPFGTLDMGGDVDQLNDADIQTSTSFGIAYGHGMRGGDWLFSSAASASSTRAYIPYSGSSNYVGFRVASVGSVPEPASIVLASLGVVGLVIFSKRLRACVCSFPAHRRVSGR